MRIAVYFLAEGSFPRMRGALVFGLIPLRIQRIIPADAGSTPVAVPLCCCFQDHPRGCGEHNWRACV